MKSILYLFVSNVNTKQFQIKKLPVPEMFKKATIFLICTLISTHLYTQSKEYKSYYENGQLKEFGHYDKSSLKTGEWKGYYRNGNLLNITFWKKGKEHGISKSYFITGVLSSEYGSKKGKLHGKYIRYYENGSTIYINQYKHGKANGEWSEYYSNGVLKTIEYKKNGKRAKERKEYFENGQLSSVCKYKKDEPGDWTSFDEDGEIDCYGTYKKGEKIIFFNRGNHSELN